MEVQVREPDCARCLHLPTTGPRDNVTDDALPSNTATIAMTPLVGASGLEVHRLVIDQILRVLVTVGE
ncbi:hypothetical protein [Actinokineospora globicatena]|uniref:Uncharacterized protein n=1 Tax=Actinokineospora globicatena TaxID=103729 RepID=A0A9W6QR61_9PSEU|nr:hypothetical protein [Actinokineospora globicatena]GLW93223.1 hypothetical protein Aglo03_40390 [Actinokineospora globicatena]